MSGFRRDAGAAAGLSGGDGIDQLLWDDGNDLLLMGHGDVAEGGSGNDLFQFDSRFGEATTGFRITDHFGGDDRIEILYVPRFSGNTSLGNTSLEIRPEIRIETSEDGKSALILLNGTLIAQMSKAAMLTVADVVLIPAA